MKFNPNCVRDILILDVMLLNKSNALFTTEIMDGMENIPFATAFFHTDS